MSCEQIWKGTLVPYLICHLINNSILSFFIKKGSFYLINLIDLIQIHILFNTKVTLKGGKQ